MMLSQRALSSSNLTIKYPSTPGTGRGKRAVTAGNTTSKASLAQLLFTKSQLCARRGTSW